MASSVEKTVTVDERVRVMRTQASKRHLESSERQATPK